MIPLMLESMDLGAFFMSEQLKIWFLRFGCVTIWIWKKGLFVRSCNNFCGGKMKRVSIIIPFYNTGRLMGRCLESIASQTVGIEDIEVIMVDDGSTDGGLSANIAKEYAAKYPNSFRLITKENGGQGSARNMGFLYATGEYVTCIDSDDAIRADWVEKMYGEAKKNEADFVGCGYKAVRLEGDNFENEIVVRELDMRPICRDKREMFIDANVLIYTTLFKRSLLDESGAKYPEGVVYEDMAFFIELLPWIKKPVYINEALNIRTLHAGSTMTIVNPERVVHVFRVFDAIIDFYRAKAIYDDYKYEVEYFMGKVLLCSSLNRVSFIKGYRIRRKLVKQTEDYLKTKLPQFRKNPYIKRGAKGFYLKHYNRFLMNIMTEVLRVRFIIKHDYNI